MFVCGHARTSENTLRSQSCPRGRCRTCHRDASNRRVWARIGVTPDDVAAMLEAQAGLCAICAEPMVPGRGTHVDHDHETNTFRGLLCDSCNHGLGKFKDDRALLASAIEYLAR